MTVSRFEELTLACEKTLYRVAWGMMKNDHDAADAVQDALLHAFEKRDSLREETYFSTWLVRILINSCKKALRERAKTAAATTDIQEIGASTPDETDQLAVREALAALPDKMRLPTILYYVEGRSVAEIASLLRLPQGTVKSRLSRARDLLRMDLA